MVLDKRHYITGNITRALIIMGLAGKTEDRSIRLWQQCRYDLDVYGDEYG